MRIMLACKAKAIGAVVKLGTVLGIMLAVAACATQQPPPQSAMAYDPAIPDDSAMADDSSRGSGFPGHHGGR